MTDHKNQRRILVITGAGASVNLGAANSPIPMMSQWATELVAAMGVRANQIGIIADMQGDQFETKLGNVLAFEKALPIIGSFAHMGTQGAPQMGVDGNFQAWFNTANQAVQEIRGQLWANLFASFSRSKIDEAKAISAYSQLHDALRSIDDSESETLIAHATTNYDTAIETGVGEHAVDGFVTGRGNARPLYRPEVLRDEWDQTARAGIPVLHLHGAVGWYYHGDGTITRLPSDEDYDDRRMPALLLPDDTKGPTTFTPAESETWTEFLYLLNRATHVIFIGHSLHDPHIVKAVVDRNAPTAAVIHTKITENGHYAQPTKEHLSEYRSKIGTLKPFGGEFGAPDGADFMNRGELQQWLKETTSTTPIPLIAT